MCVYIYIYIYIYVFVYLFIYFDVDQLNIITNEFKVFNKLLAFETCLLNDSVIVKYEIGIFCCDCVF